MSTGPNIEDSWVVEFVAWGMYLGWLSALASGALYVGIEPLASVADAFASQWQGRAAAVATGVGLLLAAGWGYRNLKSRMAPTVPGDAPQPDEARADASTPTKAKKKKKKKKKPGKGRH
jgi:hypothetical protein